MPTAKGAHGARLRPALMSQALFCAACHKVGLGTDVTAGERWLRGQNDYDAWHISAVSGNGAGSVYRPEAAKTCQDCHMPLEAAVQGDAGAKNGMVRSHRFLGANTALPHLRGDAEQERRTMENLRGRASLALLWSGPARVDALMRARGVGHRLPGGTMDSNEVWLEVTAFDAAGKVIGVSGARGRDGALDRDAHLVRAQPVDERGAPLAKRDPQHQRGMAFDAALTPSDPQVVRYEVPPGTARVRGAAALPQVHGGLRGVRVRGSAARTSRARCLDLPIAEIAAADVAAGAPPSDDPATLVDWGIALADATADHAEEARAPLEAARAKWPTRVEPLLGLARLAYRLGQTDDVVRYAARGARARPRASGGARAGDARAARRATASRPRARSPNGWRGGCPAIAIALALVARARGLTGDAAGALAAADGLLAIDPESEEGFYQRSLALAELGRARRRAGGRRALRAVPRLAGDRSRAARRLAAAPSRARRRIRTVPHPPAAAGAAGPAPRCRARAADQPRHVHRCHRPPCLLWHDRRVRWRRSGWSALIAALAAGLPACDDGAPAAARFRFAPGRAVSRSDLRLLSPRRVTASTTRRTSRRRGGDVLVARRRHRRDPRPRHRQPDFTAPPATDRYHCEFESDANGLTGLFTITDTQSGMVTGIEQVYTTWPVLARRTTTRRCWSGATRAADSYSLWMGPFTYLVQAPLSIVVRQVLWREAGATLVSGSSSGASDSLGVFSIADQDPSVATEIIPATLAGGAWAAGATPSTALTSSGLV